MARQSASWQGWSNLTLPSTEEATASSGLIGWIGGICSTSLKYETTLPTRCCEGELADQPEGLADRLGQIAIGAALPREVIDQVQTESLDQRQR